jgi:peptide/nickel transport system substrate-binding protein
MKEQSEAKQRVSRRRVLGGSVTLAAGAAGLMMVGCGDDDSTKDSQTPAASGSSTSTAKPKTGGTLTGAQVADVSFNTGYPFVFAAENPYLNSLPVESLVRYRKSLEPENVLAESYEFSSDKTKLKVALKPDLTFHNGAKVTVEDVFFGFDLINNPAAFGVTGSFQLATLVKNVIDKKKLDERTMEFTFDKARPNANDLFAQLMVTQKATYDQLKAGKDVQGTGPFKFVSWATGQTLNFEANKNWHLAGKEAGPYLDAINVKFFADKDAMALAYQAGDIDLILGPAAKDAVPYKSKGLTHVAPKVGLTYCGMNVTNPLLKDSRVRQALFLAVDRDRIVNELGEGFGDVTSQPWPSTSPAFDPDLEKPLYDPDKAKSLLKQAGFSQSDALPFELRSTYNDVGAVIKENFETVGVKVELLPIEANAFLAKLRQRQFKGFWATTHAFSDLTPLTNFQQTFPYQIPNISYYESPTYVDIIKQLESLDPLSDGAKEQYRRFNKMWLEDPWLIPLSPNSRVDLVSASVKDYGDYFITLNETTFAKTWKA